MSIQPKSVPLAEDKVARRDLEENGRLLLREMLALLRRHRDTPLQDGIDSAAIIQSALRTVSAGESNYLADLEIAQSVLDGLIERALTDEQHPEPERPVLATGWLDRAESNSAGLAAWLEHLHAVLRATHPAAVELVELRVEGCQDREIAQALGLGLRLVRRIIQDLQSAWEQATQRR